MPRRLSLLFLLALTGLIILLQCPSVSTRDAVTVSPPTHEEARS